MELYKIKAHSDLIEHVLTTDRIFKIQDGYTDKYLIMYHKYQTTQSDSRFFKVFRELDAALDWYSEEYKDLLDEQADEEWTNKDLIDNLYFEDIESNDVLLIDGENYEIINVESLQYYDDDDKGAILKIIEENAYTKEGIKYVLTEKDLIYYHDDDALIDGEVLSLISNNGLPESILYNSIDAEKLADSIIDSGHYNNYMKSNFYGRLFIN